MIETNTNLVLLRLLPQLFALDGVAWRAGDHAGLAFTRRHDLGRGGPGGFATVIDLNGADGGVGGA